MAVDTTTAPELNYEQVQRILLQPLEAASTFLASGPRIFDTANQIRIPKLGGPTDPAWYGENEQITDTDVDFDEVVLLPSTMKSIKTLTRYSNEMARQSVVALDQALKDRLVRDVATKIDTQLYSASGDGVTTPQGMFAWAGTQTVDVAGALTLDHLLDAWGKALSANVDMSRLRWVFTPREFVALRKVKDTQERYQLQPDPTVDGVFRLFGAPVTVTSRVPDTTAATPTARGALVDFSQIAVARDQAPSVKVLTETFGDYDQQAIRVTARFDAKPLNPEAVVKLTGITI